MTKRRNTTPGFNTPDPFFLVTYLGYILDLGKNVSLGRWGSGPLGIDQILPIFVWQGILNFDWHFPYSLI